MQTFDQLPAVTPSDLVASHARIVPGRTAIVCGTTRLTWREFDQRITKVANGLLALGLGHGDKVGLLMSNSAEMVEILFGINRAGCVMVPLSLLAPAEALARMIDDAGARALFVSGSAVPLIESALADLDQLGDRVFIVDPIGTQGRDHVAWRNSQSTTRTRVRLSLGDESVIVYSSGTTGVPKGIVHTQYNRGQLTLAIAVEFRFTTGSVALVTTPLYANGTWLMLLPALLVRAPLVIMPKFDPGTMLELIATERVTHTLMVPPQYTAVLAHPSLPSTDLSSLQLLASVGSTMRAEVKRAIMTAIAPRLIELYGLTEGIATILQTEDVLTKAESVGTAAFGGEIRIIDDQGCELPAGEIGEIVGYGSGLMKGYHNRPEATADAVWLADDGRTFLKTGDIGKLDEDGYLYILDRKKDMILTGAVNVYPRDIEEVIATHPDVADVTVIGIPDPKWDEVPMALVVLRAGATRDPGALRGWINERVGKHQRVARVVFRDGFPRNALGKVLKKELRAEYGG